MEDSTSGLGVRGRHVSEVGDSYLCGTTGLLGDCGRRVALAGLQAGGSDVGQSNRVCFA
jgi:hypothetical protein